MSATWEHANPSGNLVAIFCLTTDAVCDVMKKSYQYINFDGKMGGERTLYVVLNNTELLNKIVDLNHTEIIIVEYLDRPSGTAVTPYNRLFLCALSIKRNNDDHVPVKLDLSMPKVMSAGLRLVS